LKLKHEIPVSNFAFKFNVHHYILAKSRFFLPRQHPARQLSGAGGPAPPPPPPPNWREVLDAVRAARAGRTASVDDFHDFLLQLHSAPAGPWDLGFRPKP
jgi:hypothetical protein